MVRKETGVTSAKELDGATVCVQTGTTTELNLADYFARQGHDVHAGGLRGAGRGERGLRLGRLRRLHDGRFGPRGDPPDAVGPGRPHAAARDHLQGAARAGRAAGRRPVVHDRALAALRARQRRGGWRHRGERRGDEGQRRRRTSSACSGRKASSARASGSTTLGPRTRSRRWAITARSSSATSASPRRSACRAASTRCGPTAACSTPRRSASRIEGGPGDLARLLLLGR